MSETKNIKNKEQRLYTRAPADFLLSIRCIASDNCRQRDSNPISVKMVDISAGGICFVSPKEISNKDVFIITDSSSSLKLTGLRVQVLSRSMHLGAPYTLCHCRFIGMDFLRLKNIIKFVALCMDKSNKMSKEHAFSHTINDAI